MTPAGGGAGPLTDPRAERVRWVARLAERPSRLRAGAFLAEGPQCVREALAGAVEDRAAGRRPRVRQVYATAAAGRRHPDLLAAADAAGVAVHECTEAVLAAMADTTTPQGLLAVCDLREVTLDAAVGARPSLVAVLVSVRDPGNAGTVLRTADAAGAGAVVLTPGSVDVHGPKCVRSAAGSTFHLDVVEGAAVPDVAAAVRAAGLTVLAAAGADPRAADLDDLLDAAHDGEGPLAGPAAWLFGNEAHGLEAADLDLADHVVAVPLHGRAESLNLAAAAAVCLYASARGQRLVGTGGAVRRRPLLS